MQLVLMFAALVGFVGPGPLSRTVMNLDDAHIRVSYARFGRYQTPQLLQVRIGARSDKAVVWISANFLADINIERIFPEPNRVEVNHAGATLHFRRSDSTSSMITFHVRPTCPGIIRGRIGTTPDRSTPFWQFVYP